MALSLPKGLGQGRKVDGVDDEGIDVEAGDQRHLPAVDRFGRAAISGMV